MMPGRKVTTVRIITGLAWAWAVFILACMDIYIAHGDIDSAVCGILYGTPALAWLIAYYLLMTERRS